MKRRALFLLVVLVLAGAPRRASPERRAQRGERLRRLTDPAGPVGQLLGSLSGAPASGPSSLDVLKLNDGIVALLQPLLDDERGLEYLRLRFDPAETNLNRDTVHLIGAAKLRRSAWSSEPTLVDLDLRGMMQRRDDGRPRGLLDGSLRFQTDVVALANRAMTRFADRLDRRAEQGSVREAPLNAEETFRLRMREKLEATPPLETMDDVIDLILSFSGLRLTSVNDRIAELKHELDSTPDEKIRLDLAKQLDAARRQRDQMLDLHPQVDRDDSGRAVAMLLKMDRSRFDENTQVERLKVELTENQVVLELVGSTMQGMELYSLFKPLVVNTLTRVQMRDPETVRLGRGLVRGYLGQLRGALGEPPDNGPAPEPLPPPEGAKE
ncbi:MAG TPA: hypothetical protein PK867_01570 [Pirellulales bacterium]|nr:hypothetical protein [Pirellulales bacterium]